MVVSGRWPATDCGCADATATSILRLVYFSPVPWDSFAQRPHFMVRYFLERSGGQVLWIDPYPNRLPRISDFRRPAELQRQDSRRDPRVELLRPRALPVEPLPGGAGLNGMLFWRSVIRTVNEFVGHERWLLAIGRPSALSLRCLRKLRPPWSLYDAMDDFPEFYSGLSRRSMARREAQIAALVARITVSSLWLYEKFQARHSSIVLLHNACAMEALPAPQPRERSAELVLGYIGTFGAWFDWDLVFAMAGLSGLRIRLIGPLFERPPESVPSNVEVLPPCSHDAVGGHLAHFDAGLIPFRINALTRGVDPIKYYEYRAMGLPVLSTSFGEMARRGPEDGVFQIGGGDSMHAAVNAVRGFRDDAKAVEHFRQNNSWRARFDAAELFANLG